MDNPKKALATDLDPEDLPLAKEIAEVLTLEIRRFLLEKNKANIAVSDKTLSIVSHELKTPVTSLRTILQVLHRRLESDPQKFNFSDNAEYVAFSLREIDKLTVLVNDLLDFNRINRGALQFNFITMDVQPTVASAVEHMSMLCDTHTITYVGTEVSCTVSLDAPRFEQVLENVLTNAVKYSPKGSTITISMTADSEGAVITIHNEGAGIPEEEQARLFEPYYRTPSAQASSIGGLGIGLFISKQIIDAHHGTVTLASRPEEGVTVTITLPRSDEKNPGEVTHRKNEPLPVSPPPQYQST